MDNPRQFRLIFSLTVLLGLLSIVFILVWSLYFGKDLVCDGAPMVNWHALPVIVYIFLQGSAIIVFRLPWTWQWSKPTMKFIHAGLNVVALSCAVVSMVGGFVYRSSGKVVHMYSLHSWIGLSAVVLSCLQLVLGVIVYLIPVTPVLWKAKFMLVHCYFGCLLFATFIAVTLIGINEKLTCLQSPAYRDLPLGAVLANVLGLLLALFGILIIWIATQPFWKRPCDLLHMQMLHNDGGGDDSTKVGPTLSQFSEEDDFEGTGDVKKR